MSEGTGDAARGTVWRLTPAQRLWLASAGLMVAASGIWVGVMRFLPVLAQPHLPWWALAPAFLVTERWPVTVHMRRGVASLSMACAPLVVGLLFVSPLGVLAAYALGAAAAVALQHWRLPQHTVLSLAQFTVLLPLAELALRLLATPGRPLAWATWAGITLAVAVVVSGNVAVLLLLVLHDVRLSIAELRAHVLYALAGAVASAAFGLVASALIVVDAAALVPLAVAAALCLLVYRAYVAERQTRVALEFLHGAGDALGSRELESAIVQLLNRARSMFSAEIAQLTIFPATPGEKAFRTTVRADGGDHVMEPLDLSQLDDLLEAESDGVIVERTRAAAPTAEMLARRGIDEAMAALLRGETRLLGSLLVGGHVDSRSFDARDLQLFRTLAIQTGTTLENGRLERSIARLTELQERLTHQAFHDSLTDLANRTLFGDRIEHALQRCQRAGRSIAVLFIDVDDFKGVNDTLGHAAGDSLLVGIADRLRASLRRPDTAARLGGDEFAVLIEDLEDAEEATIVARRIFDGLRVPFEVMGHTVNVRVSIGVAISQGPADNASNLMRHADVAMYAAKGAGKDRWVCFAPGMETDIITRHKLRTDLEIALAGEQFVLHFQPIVDLGSGEVCIIEALVRWRHPSRGLVGPVEFISMAEESGIILPLGDHVLRSACATLLRLRESVPRSADLAISVNISARQLQQPEFVESVLTTVAETGLMPQALVLELTESILLEDAPATVVKLEALRRAGIRIAIDDFGTGYSSLSYLRRLPVEILKIAKPFVDDLAVAEANGDFARAIVGIGSALRLTLVAEGIEAAQQVTQLRRLGCSLGQGYHLCHPVSGDDIEALLQRGGVDPSRLDPEAALINHVVQLRQRA